jgi:hypothetical protein
LILSICPVATVAAQQQPQNAPSGHPIQQDVATPNNAPPDNASPGPTISVPPTLTIPAGTFVTVRLMGVLSSDQNLAGDGFSATLEQPIVVDGWVLARRGQIAVGTVVSAQKAGRVKGVSSLAVALSDLPVVDGRQIAVQSELVRTSAGTSKGRDAVGVATTTGVGAAIGGAVDGGAGAGIGAAAGAAAGIAGVLLTPGRPTVFPPETLLTFRLQAPITVDTQRGQVAFQPVGQQDYASADGPQLQRRQVVPAYPPAAYPYIYPYAAGPYWGSWGFYPAISFGYYGGYGWGRGYGWGHRGHWH